MNDQDLVRQVLNGNTKAFEYLVDSHKTLVAHMVGRVIQSQEDHEEVCQDVFLRVYNRLDEFNFQSKLSTWIATIAFRMSIDFVKKKKRYVDLNESKIDDESVASVEEETIRLDSKEYLNKIIDVLPVHFRTVITLYHLQEMTYPEIVEVTGLPEGTIKSHLFRARKLLKEKLEQFLKKEEL
ncbi:MAG: sigma-70 family RNA polymerase sigma factor [Fulvivirga sp.]|uniref:RNA polymerase sigma factor n=1 Tax=Fulvivirga sp. TaxID=1931237 RepID=UPI0032ED917E